MKTRASLKYFVNHIRYKLELLHQCGKKLKTKSQKVLWTNSYVCRRYSGNTGSEEKFLSPLPS